MTDTTDPTPITDKALLRLRALAKGNGLDPEKIVFTASEEKTYTLEGTTTLTPLFDTRVERYNGPARGKVARTLPGFEALHAEIKKRENDFRNKPDWIPAVTAELLKEPAQGWGLHDARVEIPDHTFTLAGSEACPNCQGAKNITCAQCFGRGYEPCVQCRGQRQEICYNCNGTGQNPQAPGQPCVICHGNRQIQCRMCHGTAQIPCPICQSRGAMPCPACKGAGQMTEVAHITCGATAHFSFKGEGLPSGLRRGLDRLGVINLAKGHADITFVEKKKTEEPKGPGEVIPGGLYGVAPPLTQGTPPAEHEHGVAAGAAVSDEAKAPEPRLHYTAQMPFADLRVDFGGRKAVIGVFGLRHVFLDVPPFLDDYLTPALGKLNEAVKGHGGIDTALETRALREALELNMQAKGNVKEFRRLYPFGVSNGVIENILRGTRNSIKRLTLPARSAAAAGSSLIAGGVFAGCYFTSLPQQLDNFLPLASWAFDLMPPVFSAFIGLIMLNFAAYFDLHKHFPAAKIGLKQAQGKTAYAMVLVILIIWIAVLALSPARPPWLTLPVR